jgi:DNA mismatch repair ATPase MutS
MREDVDLVKHSPACRKRWLRQSRQDLAGAAVWHAPILRVRTSIGRTDSVLDVNSYYLAEVESVRAPVRATGGALQNLFILDEIFRGTNATERAAAASAVLSCLNRDRDLVVVATHDIEVLELLGGGFDAYHFREQVDNDFLTFGYRIHSGPSSTRDAITLLRLGEARPLVFTQRYP